MDAQRALLDSLMGFNRDGDRPDEDVKDFSHARVCKSWLCGLCPRELFQNTRLDAGACPNLHVPELKARYEAERLKRDFGYERDLAKELSKLLAEVEKKIAKGQRRLDEDGDGQDREQVLQLTQQIQETVKQVDKKTQEGQVDESVELLKQVGELKRKRKELLKEGPTDVNQKLRVCDVCGAFLSIFDSERRLADHFGGKLHVGYMQIRKKLAEMAETEGVKQKSERNETSPKRPTRRRSRSRSRRRRAQPDRRRSDRERRRDRSRSRSRERRRDRSPRRHRRRSVSSSRSRSRSRSRDRRRR